MTKLTTIFLSTCILLTTATYTALAADDKVVGKYNGIEVTSNQVFKQFQPVLESQPGNKGKKFSELDKNLQEILVKGYINQKLFEKEAQKLGIRDSKEFKNKIKMIELQLMQQELIESHLKTAITDKAISAEYTKFVNNLKGKKEAKISHILVDTEERAKEVKKKIDKGEKFADLVSKFSKDEASKATGGELGYSVKEQLVPEFGSKAFAMKKNEISEPVKTQFGWHIIKLIDIRAVKIPTQKEVEQNLKGKLSGQIIEQYLKKLSDNAHVEIKI